MYAVIMLEILTMLEGLWGKNTERHDVGDILITYVSVVKLSLAFCGDGKECKDLRHF